MTNESKGARRLTSTSRMMAFAAFALLALALPGAASAQWTAPDAQGNTSTTGAGNAGVGTAAPASKLDVSGTSGVTIRTSGTSAGINIFDRPSVPGSQLVFQGNSGDYSVLNMATRNANFGSEKLSAFALWTVDNANTPNATQFQIQNSPSFGGVIFTQKFGTGAQGDKKVSFQTAWNQTAVPTQFVLDTTGNVGVGTASPLAPLQIGNYTTINNPSAPTHSQFINNAYLSYAGGGWKYMNSDAASVLQIKDGLIYYNAPSGTAGAPLTWNERMRIDNAGNVGIGTSNPVARLQVGGQADNLFQVVSTGSGSTDTVANFASAAGNIMIVRGNGRVGIGNTNPTQALDVVGNITVSGNINAKYQDVAEWVPSTQKLQAGTVVVLDTGRDNHVAASTSAYDTRVAGVVSAQPGIALGEAGEGKALVATTGRVKVKVDATQGPIRVGDLLVTSDRAGYAMKSEPMLIGKRQFHSPGTIVGKALESLDKGTGEILVLLSLQ